MSRSMLSYHQDYPWSEYLDTPERYKLVIEACLLTEIVRRNSHIPLDQAYLDWKRCGDLLCQNRPFRLLLLEAWESSNFSRIIESSLLRGTSDATATYNYYGTTHTIVHGDANTYISYNFGSDDGNKSLESLCARDYNAIQKETYAKRVGSTGDWFLHSIQFNSWVNDPKIRTLWCPGIPGVGKTVVSSVVVGHLRSQSPYPVCVVYLNYKHQNDQNLHHVLGAILRQLGENNTEVRHMISSSCSPGLTLTDGQLHDLLKAACCLFNHVFIIIDALDEFLEFYSQDAIIELQTALSAPSMKVMITSRIIGSIESVFEYAAAMRCEITSDRDDMEQYIRHRISRELPFASGIVGEIVTKVLEAAKERFLLTELHMSSICRLFTIGHVRSTLKNLANQVDHAYAQVLHRIEEQEAYRREIARQTLSWVAYARRALRFSDLQLILAASSDVTEGDDLNDYVYPLDVVCACCAGLVYLDPTDQTLRLIHFTAQEFFKLVQNLKFPNVDTFITKSLMTYISHISRSKMNARIWPCDLESYILDHFLQHLRSAEQDLFPDLQAVKHTIPQLCHAITWMNKIAASNPFIEHNSCSHSVVCGLWKIKHSCEGLVEAVTLDLPVLLSILLESGTATNTVIGAQRHTPLTIAAWCGACRCVEVLLARADVVADWQTGWDMTPLSLAIMSRSKSIVKLLVRRSDVDVNKPVLDGITPLTLAATRPDHSLLPLLLDVPSIEVNAKNPLNGLTALFQAIFLVQIDVVKAVLAHSKFDEAANTIEEGNSSGDIIRTTPLTAAIRVGNDELILLFRQTERYDIGYRTNGRSLLSFAAQNGITWLAKELIELEAETIDLPDEIGRTPFSYCSSADISQLLLAARPIRVDLADKDGRTPLSHAVSYGCYVYMCDRSMDERDAADLLVKTIVNSGSVNVNSRDRRGRTPISYASTVSCIQLLLDYGADLNLPDENGRTLLSYAVEGGFLEAFEFMLNQGNVQVNLIDSTGRTPFSYARSANMQRDLLRKGAIPELDTGLSVSRPENPDQMPNVEEGDIDRLDADGCTRLLKASMPARGSLDSFDFAQLMCKEPDPNARDKHGRTPLSYLAEDCRSTGWTTIWQHIALMYTLLDKGADINAVDNEGLTALDYAQVEEVALFLIMRGGVTGAGMNKSVSGDQSEEE